MSRQIDVLSGPLSSQDREYLISRGRRHLVLQNERMFPEGEEPATAPQSQDEPERDEEWEAEVNQLTVAELRDELSNRGLDSSGNKETLRARLVEAGPED